MESKDLKNYIWVVDANQKKIRIDKYLSEKISPLSRTKIQYAIKKETVLVNDRSVNPNYCIQPGDKITIVEIVPYEKKPLKKENIPLDIVYQDRDIIIVNKSAGMVVHPAQGNWSATLVNALAYHFDELPQREDDQMRLGIVHRIDKYTSGLLLVAKNENSLSFLAQQFKKHDIERSYYALIWGVPSQKKDTITANIIRHPKERKKFTVCLESEGGKSAITHYEVIQDFHFVSLVKCKLETGRTHQIRVHFQHIGHPVFSDTDYGGNRIHRGNIFSHYKRFVEECFSLMPYQALHAHSLGFVHPRSKEKKIFTQEVPDNFLQLLKKWENFVSPSKLS